MLLAIARVRPSGLIVAGSSRHDGLSFDRLPPAGAGSTPGRPVKSHDRNPSAVTIRSR
jgi:hypothetical protein